MARRRSIPAAWLHSAAGTWRGAGHAGPLLRIPSPPVDWYRRIIDVPIGNDGIAFPTTFSGAGVARVQAGPEGIGTWWDPVQAYAYTSVGQLDSALVSFYVGPAPTGQYQVAANLTGGGAQVALSGHKLMPGWFVFAVWANGTPGATAYMIVSGDKTALTI